MKINQILFVIILGLSTSACELVDGDKGELRYQANNEIKKDEPIQVKEPSDVYYDFIKVEIMDKSCIRCHNANTAISRGRLDLTKKENIIREFSDIEYRMTEAFDMGFDYMPPKGDPVKPELIKVMQMWKERGFK